MTINEYIEKYCTLEIRAKYIIATMTVPYASPEMLDNNDAERFVIFCDDIERYLEQKNYTVDYMMQNDSITNTHPNGLTATWKWRHSMKIKTKSMRGGFGVPGTDK